MENQSNRSVSVLSPEEKSVERLASPDAKASVEKLPVTGKKPAAGKKLLSRRRSAAYARRLFSASQRREKETEEDIGTETGCAISRTVEEGTSTLSRFYQRAGIKREYEAMRKGNAAGAASRSVAARIKAALSSKAVAGRISTYAARNSPFLLLSGAVFLSLVILVGCLASAPLLFQGGSTLAVQSVPHYDIPPEYLSDEKFARMIAEGEKYLGLPYVWGGETPATGFDCSGFVSWVINHCGNGWHYGRLVASELFGICAIIPPEEAKPGDLVFFQGTYETYGASHLGIYVGDNVMLHCGDPIQYTSIDTDYWRQHFLAFGRLPEP